MADRFALVARAYLDAYFPNNAVPVFDSPADEARSIYVFLAIEYPNIELTRKTVERVAWTVGMIGPQPKRPGQ